MSYPSTARLRVWRDPQRPPNQRILEIAYHDGREFGHTWEIHDWTPELEGKWTFNRGDVPIASEWWPAEYYHDTLQGLLDHLEATFAEGVPANRPD